MGRILETPLKRRREEFLAAVARSRTLHRHWAFPPRTVAAFDAYLKRIQTPAHIGLWVCAENTDLAGVIDINEIEKFGSAH